MNIAPERTGKMNASVAAVMRDVGRALNDTFGSAVASLAGPATLRCGGGDYAVLDVPPGAAVDYVVSAEDLARGQRIANYSVEYESADAPGVWSPLVPLVRASASALGDRPDGHDPRDARVGHKRIDAALPAANATRARFACLRSLGGPATLRTFSLHARRVPWERA